MMSRHGLAYLVSGSFLSPGFMKSHLQVSYLAAFWSIDVSFLSYGHYCALVEQEEGNVNQIEQNS